MKKLLLLCFIIVFLLTVSFVACNKNEIVSSTDLLSNRESDEKIQNEATWISLGPEKGLGVGFKIFLGHSVKDCGGSCIKILGEYGHIDCVGFGNVCKQKGSAYYFEDGEEEGGVLVLVEATTFGDYLEYPFPNRSLFITNPLNNTDLWLNIPKQNLVRNDFEESFMLYNVWFSEDPELENE
ncbi:MAG: hypothetical protein LBU83_12305 [Bacteroidales bacterium]|jgi:hypothetical protein|nr:hypothetical protein [Bacteroidales bacterium]